jgi:ABC-type ATPase with predicted acetyltransferase domain
MVDWDKLYYTPFYNWTEIPGSDGKIYQIYCQKMNGWAIFTYRKDKKVLNLLQEVDIYCDSFEKANQLVYDVLKLKRWRIHERYLGRYFKLKKMIGKEIEHYTMDNY